MVAKAVEKDLAMGEQRYQGRLTRRATAAAAAAATQESQAMTVHQDDFEDDNMDSDAAAATSNKPKTRQASSRGIFGDASNKHGRQKGQSQQGANKNGNRTKTTRSSSMGAVGTRAKNNDKKKTNKIDKAVSEGAGLEAAAAAAEPVDPILCRRRSARLSNNNNGKPQDGQQHKVDNKAKAAGKTSSTILSTTIRPQQSRAASRGRQPADNNKTTHSRGRSKSERTILQENTKKRPAATTTTTRRGRSQGGSHRASDKTNTGIANKKRPRSQTAAQKRQRDNDQEDPEPRTKKARRNSSRSASASRSQKKKTGQPKSSTRSSSRRRKMVLLPPTPPEPANGLSRLVGHNLVRPPILVDGVGASRRTRTSATAEWDATQYSLGLSRHDQSNAGHVLEAPEYVTDIYQRLFHAETQNRVVPYMDQQEKLTANMRAILVDWLIEVHLKFRLVPDTIYLAVNIVDRYLTRKQVERKELQLVGVTALLLACKYEEIYPPEVRDLVYICDRAYTRQEVLDMEYQLLNVLEFDVTVVTAYPFLTRFLFLLSAPPTVTSAAHYYMERTLQEHDMLQFPPSLLAMAAVCLAVNHPEIRHQDNLGEDNPGVPPVLLEYTGFDRQEVLDAAEAMAGHIQEEPPETSGNKRKLIAVRRKFDHARFAYVSVEYEHPLVEDILINATTA